MSTAWATADWLVCSSCGWQFRTILEHDGRCYECRSTPPPVAPDDEWAVFVAAITQAARDGEVHQSAVRPLIRGRIEPKHIGTLYRRAKAEGLLTDTGRREPSNDVAGRNSDKLDRIYALGRTR